MRPKEPIYINAINIKSGGGLQKTRSFLKESVENFPDESFVWFVIRGSLLHKDCVENKIDCVAVESGAMSRFRFELAVYHLLSRSAVCFNVGGPVLIGSLLAGARNISECAYSNLFYPEIDFWRFESFFNRQKRRMIDIYRKASLGLTDLLLVQTRSISERARSLGLFEPNEVEIIGVSPSSVIDPGSLDAGFSEELARRFAGRFVILLPCGSQRNKRLDLLPDVAANLKLRGVKKPLFVLLLEEGDNYWREIQNKARRLGCEQYFVTVGPRDGSEYSSVLMASDAICNIAVLESFSNSFVEAWKFEKLLIVSDVDWAKSSAGEAAIYVDPEEPDAFAQAILACIHGDQNWRATMVKLGLRQLSSFPSPSEKSIRYISFLRSGVQRRCWLKKIKCVVRWVFGRNK